MSEKEDTAAAPGQPDEAAFHGGGLVLFGKVRQAIDAEKALREAGYRARLVSPPPHMRKGCDLAVEVNLVERLGVERALDSAGVAHEETIPLHSGSSELLQVVRVVDFGEWTMVKAGNMKVSFDKRTGAIVNTSGGGCPDIPLLHAETVDRQLTEAPRPKEVGFTLCALMMDRALEECLALWNEEGLPTRAGQEERRRR